MLTVNKGRPMQHSADLIDLPSPPESRALRLALMESRQRWRQFGAIATDLAFETDSIGNLTFVAPETVLGWPASELLGRPLRWLLADESGPDPFSAPYRSVRRHTWLRARTGDQACMALTVVPLHDESGRQRGVLGVAVNVTQQERAQNVSTAALRRGEVLDHIMARMRQELLAPRMMEAVLTEMQPAIGCSGVVVIDLTGTDPPPVLHAVGLPLPSLGPVLPLLLAGDEETRSFVLPDGVQLLACRCSTRFGDRAALIGWRLASARVWYQDDLALAGSVSGLIRLVLEHESIQRELARQARTDPLTGLLNRRAFLEEANRRIDRLERDDLPGTLLFIDLDRLKQLNDRAGHDAGDSALLLIASLLKRTFRPADLIARLGGDEFAVWLDGADSLTAAERAESLRLAAPAEFAHLTAGSAETMSMSIGIATREPGHDETLDTIIQYADAAMYQVKRSGRGSWRVYRPDGVA